MERNNEHRTPEENHDSTPRYEFIYSEQASSLDVPTNGEAVALRTRRRWYRRPLFWSILGGALVVVAVAALLFLPILPYNVVENTFDEVFFDSELLLDLVEEYADEGVQGEVKFAIPENLLDGTALRLEGELAHQDGRGAFELVIGSEENALTLNVYYDDSIVAVSGLYEDPKQYVSLPRRDIAAALEKSAFHYDSDSVYKLDKESYDELLSALVVLETPSESEEDRMSDEKLAKRILKAWEKEFDPKTRINARDGAFGLQSTVEITLDRKKAEQLLDLALEEATDAGRPDMVNRLRAWKDALPTDFELRVAYTVAGGRVQSIFIDYVCDDEEFDTRGLKLTLLFAYDGKEVGFDFLVEKEYYEDGVRYLSESEGGYRKTKEKKMTDLRIWCNYTAKLAAYQKTVKEWRDEAKISYDRKSEVWSMELNEDGAIALFGGECRLDSRKNSFYLDMDQLHKGENRDVPMHRDIVVISFSEYGGHAIPDKISHSPLLEMDDQHIKRLIRAIPAKEIDAVSMDLFGTPLFEGTFPMTLCGKLLTDVAECSEKMNTYLNAYRSKVYYNPSLAQNIYVYDLRLHVYFVIRYHSASYIVYGVTYDEEMILGYTQAHYRNGQLVW